MIYFLLFHENHLRMSTAKEIANKILWDLFENSVVRNTYLLPPRILKTEPKYLTSFSKYSCIRCKNRILNRDLVYLHKEGIYQSVQKKDGDVVCKTISKPESQTGCISCFPIKIKFKKYIKKCDFKE